MAGARMRLLALIGVVVAGACSSSEAPRAPDATGGLSNGGHCADLAVLSAGSVFLGRATSDATAVDGVCNPSGDYGNEFAPLSIFDKSSVYGGMYSPEGAYNATANKSPRLVCRTTGDSLASVSKNKYLPNAIDPDALCASLAAAGY